MQREGSLQNPDTPNGKEEEEILETQGSDAAVSEDLPVSVHCSDHPAIQPSHGRTHPPFRGCKDLPILSKLLYQWASEPCLRPGRLPCTQLTFFYCSLAPPQANLSMPGVPQTPVPPHLGESSQGGGRDGRAAGDVTLGSSSASKERGRKARTCQRNPGMLSSLHPSFPVNGFVLGRMLPAT